MPSGYAVRPTSLRSPVEARLASHRWDRTVTTLRRLCGRLGTIPASSPTTVVPAGHRYVLPPRSRWDAAPVSRTLRPDSRSPHGLHRCCLSNHHRCPRPDPHDLSTQQLLSPLAGSTARFRPEASVRSPSGDAVMCHVTPPSACVRGAMAPHPTVGMGAASTDGKVSPGVRRWFRAPRSGCSRACRPPRSGPLSPRSWTR